jgi:hypothetical protein
VQAASRCSCERFEVLVCLSCACCGRAVEIYGCSRGLSGRVCKCMCGRGRKVNVWPSATTRPEGRTGGSEGDTGGMMGRSECTVCDNVRVLAVCEAIGQRRRADVDLSVALFGRFFRLTSSTARRTRMRTKGGWPTWGAVRHAKPGWRRMSGASGLQLLCGAGADGIREGAQEGQGGRRGGDSEAGGAPAAPAGAFRL